MNWETSGNAQTSTQPAPVFRGLRLLKHYGPFRLFYREALFRAPDIRASILAKAQ